jgi:hypothetical protein
MAFPKEHWSQLHSTNPIERLNREVKRRTNVVAIFPNESAIIRLVGALLLEQNDEWAVRRRYMSLETLAGLSDDPAVRSKAICRLTPNLSVRTMTALLHHALGHYHVVRARA